MATSLTAQKPLCPAQIFSHWVHKLPHRLYFDNVIFYCVSHHFANRMHLEFSHDIGSMSLDCFYAYAENHCQLLAALAFRKELHNFSLAWCQSASTEDFQIRSRI